MRGRHQPFLYFLRPVGALTPVKIGHSAVPESRLLAMMQWSPVDLDLILTVPADREYETRAHCYLASTHFRGEWFHFSPELEAMISALRARRPLDEAIPETDNPHPVRHDKSHKRTPEARERQSYNSRLYWARQSGFDIVSEAYVKWEKMRPRRGHLPMPDDVKRDIDTFASAPHVHGAPGYGEWGIKRRVAYFRKIGLPNPHDQQPAEVA